MMHWLHHIIFDPLSAWERFKIDMLGLLVPIVIGSVYIIYGVLKQKGRSK